jgi:SAM-dependent methyltransferase
VADCGQEVFGFPGPERVYGYQGMQYHRELLRDRQRIDAYRRAIVESLSPGGVVVDLGARIGVLSLLACQAGAGHVYLIERNRSMATVARVLAAENGYSQRITFLEEDMEGVQLPQPADLLVSDWLNPWFGVGSNIFGLVIQARDRFLKPGGALVPVAADLFLAPVEAPYLARENDFWDTALPGLNTGFCRELAVNNCYIARLDPQGLLAAEKQIGCWDFTVARDDTFQAQADFVLERAASLHGLCAWFDVRMSPTVLVSTSPRLKATTWFQSYLPLSPPASVEAGDRLEVTLHVGRRESPGGPAVASTVVSWEARLSAREGERRYRHSTLKGYPAFGRLLRAGTPKTTPGAEA